MALSDVLGARLAVALVALLSVVVVWRLDAASGERYARLRSRFVLGVPWGTLLTICFVLGVYLFVQGGLANWNAPLVLPFRAWSYLYPLGIVTAPFAHASPGHLLGNLIGTLAFAPIAEYAWGHYRRSPSDSRPQSPLSSSLSFPSPSTSAPRSIPFSAPESVLASPLGRILVFFCGTIAIGLVTSLFALGPVIGFSGVVFAFAGFALVRYPLATVIALAGGGVLRLVYSALTNPVTTASAEPSFAAPWWAGIAIQGHALGLLCGVLLGAFLVRRRNAAPPALRLWFGVLIFAVSQSLWAVYWYRGGETYVLFRALGTVLVFALATLVAVGVATPDRSLSSTLAADRSSLPSLDRARALVPDVDFSPGVGFDADVNVGLSARRLATAVLIAALLGMALPAIPINLTVVADESTSDAFDPSASGPITADSAALSTDQNTTDSAARTRNGSNATGLRADAVLEIRGYTIRYAEDIENELVSVIDVSAFGETTAVNTSGVIVTNADREIWTTAISKSRLQFAGRTSIRVGGLGWQEVVRVRRTGWTLAGGNTTYKVFLHSPDEKRRLAYAAPRATATPVLAGKNVSISPAPAGYTIVVSRGNDTLGRAPIPPKNGTATVAGLTFERREGRLVAMYGKSEIPIAKRETYRGG